MIEVCDTSVKIYNFEDGTVDSNSPGPSLDLEIETGRLTLTGNGLVSGFWWNEMTSGQYLVQMQDLSLHFIFSASPEAGHGSQLVWTREEGLSDLKQVEILE